MITINPFSDNATGNEREVLLLILLLDGLKGPDKVFSLKEYDVLSRVMEYILDEKIESVDHAVTVEVDNEEQQIRFRLSDQIQNLNLGEEDEISDLVEEAQ